MPQSDASNLRTEAARCRRLASGADDRTVTSLIGLAEELEAKAKDKDAYPPAKDRP